MRSFVTDYFVVPVFLLCVLFVLLLFVVEPHERAPSVFLDVQAVVLLSDFFVLAIFLPPCLFTQL